MDTINFNKRRLPKIKLLEFYQNLLLPRMIEEKMLKLLRQGKISKWFSGIGQEAIAVGATLALEEDETIFPMHRNLGVFTSRNIPLEKLFKQWQGKLGGFTQGRDRSFHFGTNDYNIWGMISHLGPQLSIAGGIGLAHKLAGEQKVALAFTGEGGTSEGEFHEALNVAAVWNLPVIFLIENNGYGLSTPIAEQYACKQLADRGIGYGMESVTIDGNNVLEVYETINKYAKSLRKKPRPILIEAMTFRMRGHEEASGTKYVPKKLMDAWAKKDPVINYENYLVKQKLLSDSDIEALKASIKNEINEGLELSYAEADIQVNHDKEVAEIYKPHDASTIDPKNPHKEKRRFVDALHDSLKQSMERHHNLIIMGQDVADYGGVFKITDGFTKLFGKDRVRNTPLCESAILGIGLGLAAKGYKSVIEMQFADFVTCGFNQIVNNIAKIQYRWGQASDIVVRMPTGGGVGAGPFHSQSTEAWFFHVPGLKIVYPSNTYDAKGLLNASIEDPNPVMFFEHKALYRSISDEIPNDYYTCEIGKAAYAQQGEDITIITYGMGVHWAKELSTNNPDVSIAILDLRTLIPLDTETIYESVKATGKVIVLHEDTLTGGIGGEISALINENCFEHLDAPVRRVASLDTPVPFAKDLERNFLGKDRLQGVLDELVGY